MLSTCAIIGIVVVLIVVFFLVYKCSSSKKENYSNLSGLSSVGSLDDYEFIQASEMNEPNAQFANFSDKNTLGNLPQGTVENMRPMDRLNRVQGSELMPRISNNVTPYNIDVADPTTFSYQVNPPRVQLKDPQWIQSDFYRGDIPISYYPNVSLINQSRFSRDSLNLSGFFSDGFNSLYDKTTGRQFKNMPQKIVNEETIMDY
jgi:hypothetical protein